MAKIETENWKTAKPGDEIVLDGLAAIADESDNGDRPYTTLDITGDPKVPQGLRLNFRNKDFLSVNRGTKKVKKESCILLYNVKVLGDLNDKNTYEYIVMEYEVQ